MKKLKIVFAGTPEFAAIILGELVQSSHEVVGVMTQPDRPAGRGLKVLPSLVKQRALELKIPVMQPTSLKLDGKYGQEAENTKTQLEQLAFDVMIVAAYGLILPQWVLSLGQSRHALGCINVHASLLPRWRGAAPIHRAIWAGDEVTGTCIMKMAEGLDTGPIIAQEMMPIQSLDTTATLHDRLAAQGARILLEVLDHAAQLENITLTEQASIGVTYAEKIKKEEAKINWNQPANLTDRQIRALNPSPGAITSLNNEIVKIWLSENISHQWQKDASHRPGQVLELDEFGISVAGAGGVIRLLEIQKAGSKRMSATQFAKSVQLKKGQFFE
ncbi:MAG: methionyl-tRNA formyltransferase [Betaproteobacteria bacterium]|jgi:methionyl-tRNA formyltransferase